MKIIRNAIAAAVVAAVSVAACSSQHGATSTGTASNTNHPTGTTAGQAGSVGKVGMSWLIGTGITLTDLTWNISGGPGGSYGPFDIPIGTAMSAESVQGGIAAGCGYIVHVQGSDSNGDPCSGTTMSFCVNAGMTAYEQVGVICLEPTDGQVAADVSNGSVAIEAGVTAVPVAPYTCPGITSFSIVPAELLGSNPAAVSIATTGTVSSVQWTAGGCNNSPGQGPGTGSGQGFANPSAASTTFNCGTCMGQVPITATIEYDQTQPGSDAPSSVCTGAPFTTFNGLINCEGGGVVTCFMPQINCGGTCVNTQGTDNANCGACGAICAAPESCAGGVCGCPGGGVFSGGICCPAASPNNCGGTCTNTQTDNNNCGGCGAGFACNVAGGFSCQAGVCKPPPPVACTGPGTPAGCVPCANNAAGGGTCTPTEQVIVDRDIIKGNLTGNTLSANSCYSCLIAAGCLDDTMGDSGQECADLSGTVGGGAFPAEAKSQACVSTLACALGVPASSLTPAPLEPAADFSPGNGDAAGVSCGNSLTDGIANCYCGSAFTTTVTCGAASGTTVNGVCETVELDGLGDTTATSPSTIIGVLTTPTSGSGMANNILKCAGTNATTPACPVCFH